MNILPLFFEINEFCRRFEPIWNQHLLAQNCKKRNRRRSLALSEVMTILVLFHQSGYRNLCSYCWQIDKLRPLIYYEAQDSYLTNREIYWQKSINFDSLYHLNSIGLIRFQRFTEFTVADLPDFLQVSYQGIQIDLELLSSFNPRCSLIFN